MRIVFICFCLFFGMPAHGVILHFDDVPIHMGAQKITSPSLVTKINGQNFYAPMYPANNPGVCTIYNGEKYNVFSELEYLYFDGNSYIDLGFSPSVDLNFEIKAWYDDTVANNNGRDAALIGARYGDWLRQYILWYGNVYGFTCVAPRFFFVPSQDTDDLIKTETTKPNVFRWYNQIFTINDVPQEIKYFTLGTDTSLNLVLGGVNHVGSVLLYTMFLGRIYYAKFWLGDKLIMDLHPAIDTSGVPCMYDTVSKSFFYNKGSGNFKY